MPGHRHNAGSLKQKNKAHGSTHSSKRSLKRAQGGKVNAQPGPANVGGVVSGTTINGMHTGMKLKRLQQTKQLRKQKKAQDMLDRRTGTRIGAPLVILLMPMGPSADEVSLANEIMNAADRTSFSTLNSQATNGAFLAVFENLKTRIHVITAPQHFGSFELLDVTKSADIIVPLFSAKDGTDNAVNEVGMQRVGLLRAHGMPAVVACLQHTNSLSIKAAGEFKRMTSKFMTDEFGEHSKLIATNPHQALITAARQAKVAGSTGEMIPTSSGEPTGVDITLLIRTVSQISLRTLGWRDLRGYMLASDITLHRKVDLVNSTQDADEPCLAVSGYVRGSPLHVDQLIHIPGMGARRILQIMSSTDPCPLKPPRVADSMNSESSGNVLAVGDSTRGDPLRIWAKPNTLIGEQTWPDMAEYENDGMHNEEDVTLGGGGSRRKKPAGVSDYQAVWLGSDDEEEEDEENDGLGGGVVSLGSEAGKLMMQSNEEPEEEEDDGQFSFLKSDNGLKLDGLDEMTAEELARDKEERKRMRANEDMEFPDEVDVPGDMLAKDRFARYRSLESFRMSPWDPKESLPRAYGRLFDLGNFKTTQKRILERDLDSAKKAETANLLKLLPSASRSAAPSNEVIASSFSLPSGGGGGSQTNEGAGNDFYDLENDQDIGNEGGEMMEGSNENNEEVGKNEPRSDGWLSTGAYVTLVLSAFSDQERSGEMEENESQGLAKTYHQDMEQFNRIMADHAANPNAPFSLHALHRHENRLTCVHASIQRSSTLFLPPDEVVATKEVLWIVCGFRKWKARPLFSMNNLNSDKHKSERFLLGGAGHFTVASCYGPATYSPSPFLLFREHVQPEGKSNMQLVGHGTIGSVDVDRIVLKRVILTGYPARVHKRTAIIKHMFQTPEDVMWFKPAPLVTKMGLEGHIQCPVGDHGLFRVHFGRAIKGHDTVCLHLYKRVYPKFADVAEGEQDDDGAGALSLSVL